MSDDVTSIPALAVVEPIRDPAADSAAAPGSPARTGGSAAASPVSGTGMSIPAPLVSPIRAPAESRKRRSDSFDLLARSPRAGGKSAAAEGESSAAAASPPAGETGSGSRKVARIAYDEPNASSKHKQPRKNSAETTDQMSPVRVPKAMPLF
jgi:hypothetical protein